jgi:hypothetical protein
MVLRREGVVSLEEHATKEREKVMENAAQTNAEIEELQRNPNLGTPAPLGQSYVVSPASMAKGKIVRLDERIQTSPGSIRTF